MKEIRSSLLSSIAQNYGLLVQRITANLLQYSLASILKPGFKTAKAKDTVESPRQLEVKDLFSRTHHCLMGRGYGQSWDGEAKMRCHLVCRYGLSPGDCVRWGPGPLNFRPMFIIAIVISLEHCTGVRRYWFVQVQVQV